MTEIKESLRLKRHGRFIKRLKGRLRRPRLVIHRSNKNLYIQIVDDDKRRTIISASTLDKEIKGKVNYGGNAKAATLLGQFVAQKAKEKGIQKVVFDRAGYAYHGRIRKLAEEARKAGLEF